MFCLPLFYPLPLVLLFTFFCVCLYTGILGTSQVVLVVKNPSANAGDITDKGSISGSGRSPGGGHGNPLQYSCLENLMDRGAWQVIVHSVTKSRTRLKWLSMHAQWASCLEPVALNTFSIFGEIAAAWVLALNSMTGKRIALNNLFKFTEFNFLIFFQVS